ncbi:hypothetical protein QQS21_009429 [Conoideocrella luteorostrata]|uniref:Uncharacterized protein n=1 Tax=Conoideocrella luteorostrata TaxID=1105319 RepID=A0AAJ0CHV4_9HYPO|nr:hypothetical protein QQS21_009429 [Conoideocrella luteorostrata]
MSDSGDPLPELDAISDRANDPPFPDVESTYVKYLGQWLQKDIDDLEAIANANYNSLLPRPIDPGVVFDLLKVRKSLDTARELAETAEDWITRFSGTWMKGLSSSSAFDGDRATVDKNTSVRKLEIACRYLARSLLRDDMAVNIAQLHSHSAVLDIAGAVLQSNSSDSDAKYVSFLHQNIKTEELADITILQTLMGLTGRQYGEPELFRTIADIKAYQEDFDGAAEDFGRALETSSYPQSRSSSSVDGSSQGLTVHNDLPREQDAVLAENDQPSGFKAQIIFRRAHVYLSRACGWVDGCFPSSESSTPRAHQPDHGGREEKPSQSLSEEQRNSKTQVKRWAEKALNEFMHFLSHFDYSPNVPKQMKPSLTGSKPLPTQTKGIPPHIVYSLEKLFSDPLPPNLPAFPPSVPVKKDGTEREHKGKSTIATCELVTYHPHLTDALHAVLLCHCLLQTAPPELLQHAYMVARLVRLAHGFPLFIAPVAAAAFDWKQIIRQTETSENSLHLSSVWDELCHGRTTSDEDASNPISESVSHYLSATQSKDQLISDRVEPIVRWMLYGPSTQDKTSVEDTSALIAGLQNLTTGSSSGT